MPAKREWTDALRAEMCALREAGLSWDAIAAALHVGQEALGKQARLMGLDPRALVQQAPPPAPAEPARGWDPQPLPAGHRISWGLLMRLTPSLGG